MEHKPLPSIVVLDFGSQYTQLIARRIREFNVFSVVLPCTASLDEIRAAAPVGIILSGGPSSVYDADAPAADAQVLHLGLPVLGICYGLHFMTHALGGKVRPGSKREYGHAEVSVEQPSLLFEGLPKELSVWMSHGDEAEELAPGFKLIARSATAIAAIEDAARRYYAVQFHPEVHHTPLGSKVLRNFVFAICQAEPSWTAQKFIDSTVAGVRELVGPAGRAICAISGGVDSSVAATLVHRAIGDRLTCVFVNNGVLRKNEFAKVQESLRTKLHLNIDAVDASERFLTKLAGVDEPERKRKIIGNEFIAIFDEEARRVEKTSGHVEWLVQGTLYPDVIESVSVKGPAATIKSHHNVGGLPSDLKFRLVEPLRELFKDEVRVVGRELGLSAEVVNRQPFPGPGLAVRIVGEVTEERLRMVREADAIVLAEVRAAGFYQRLWQSFAVLLPVSSVGVMGDARTYASTIAVRAVESEDGMTADWAKLPAELLERIATRVVNEVKGVNRVLFDLTSKPPGTIEWE